MLGSPVSLEEVLAKLLETNALLNEIICAMHRPIAEPEAPIGIDEAAKFLKFKKSTLHRLARKGEVPVYQPFNGKLLFFRSKLRAFVLASTKKQETV